jgi:hypothetical protein
VDYLDGKLSDKEILLLEDFLLINPDLRAELEGTEKITLSPENIVFNQKEFLKKPDLSLPVNESNFEDFCIAESEGDLDRNQRNSLFDFTKSHPESDKLYMLYRQLHLIPDRKIDFPDKGRLRKTVLFIPREVMVPVLSVAAALAIMLVVYLKNDNLKDNMTGLAADFPTDLVDKNKSTENNNNSTISETTAIIPEISQASIIPLSSSKQKKQPPVEKKTKLQEKKSEDQKSNDILPQQKLNPSFQIKLPSVADNQVLSPSIESDKISYSKQNPKPVKPEYLSLSEYARQQLAVKVLGNSEAEPGRISAWDIADAGISGINKLTGGEMKLEKRTNASGNLTAYSFNSRLFSYSTTSVKNQKN